MKAFYSIFMLILGILFCSIYAITPYVWKRNILFGVRLPVEGMELPEVKKVRRDNTVMILAVLILTIGISPMLSNEWMTFLIPALVIICPFIYLLGHFRIKKIKEQSQWVFDEKETVTVGVLNQQDKKTVSLYWFLINALLIGVTVATGWFFYDHIPQQVPMHMDVNGLIDRYAEKSLKLLLLAPMSQVYITVIMMLSMFGIRFSKRQLDNADPEGSLKASIRFRRGWSVWTISMSIVLCIMFYFIQLFMMILPQYKDILPYMISISVGSILLSLIYMLFRYRRDRGLSRVAGMAMRNDDRFWKLGMFYFNPDDAAIIVEKRMGIGWTFNFARPASWVIFLGLLLFIALFSTGIEWIA